MFMPLSGHVSKTEGIMVDNGSSCHYYFFFSMVEGFMMGDGSLLLFLSSAQGKRYCVWGGGGGGGGGGIIIVCLVKNQIGKKVLCVGVSLLDAWSICIMLVLLVEGREYYYGQFIFISLFFVNLLQNVFQ